MAFHEAHLRSFARFHSGCPGSRILHGIQQKGLQPAFRTKRVHDDSARNARNHAHHHINDRELPAQKSPQQDHGDFIDQRRGDQEGHGYAQGNPGCGEAQEKRDAGTGAERRNSPESCPQDIADAPAFPRQIVPDPLNVHRGPQPADDIDHKNEQQEDLCRVIEKEFDGITQWRSLADRKKIIGQPL